MSGSQKTFERVKSERGLHEMRIESIQNYIKCRLDGEQEKLLDFFVEEASVVDEYNGTKSNGKKEILEYYNKNPVTWLKKPTPSNVFHENDDYFVNLSILGGLVKLTAYFFFKEDSFLFEQIVIKPTK